jgi:hypothetical protein
MHPRPRLIAVRLVPWELDNGVYGIACEYSDDIEHRERWGTKEETEIAVALRERDIYSPANLKP